MARRRLEQFAAWQWGWLSTPSVFLLSAVPATVMVLVAGFKLQGLYIGMDAPFFAMVATLSLFCFAGVYLRAMRQRYEDRLAREKADFTFIFGESAENLSNSEAWAVMQLRVDGILTQLASTLEKAGDSNLGEANEHFCIAHHLAKSRGFDVKESYRQYLYRE
jgi:hypothetical protein